MRDFYQFQWLIVARKLRKCERERANELSKERTNKLTRTNKRETATRVMSRQNSRSLTSSSLAQSLAFVRLRFCSPYLQLPTGWQQSAAAARFSRRLFHLESRLQSDISTRQSAATICQDTLILTNWIYCSELQVVCPPIRLFQSYNLQDMQLL